MAHQATLSKPHRPRRFARATANLDLDALQAPLRRLFYQALSIALLLHLALAAFDPFTQRAAKSPRPLTAKFVKRQPRLTKPLELRKVPQRRRQLVRRQVRAAAARLAVCANEQCRLNGPPQAHALSWPAARVHCGRAQTGWTLQN